MATGSSEVNTRLDEKDLPELLRVLHPARIEYNSFGLQIGVWVGEIACIEQTHKDPRHCLREILTARLKKSEPLTWNDIVAALREECVGLGKIADDIRQQYAHLFTPTISMASKYEHEKEFDRVIREADSEDDEIETCRQRHERISEQDSDEEVGGREKRTQSLRKRESKHEIKSKDILKPKEYVSMKKKSPGGDHRSRVSKEGERSSEYEGIEEEKELASVFECFYGQLCCVEFNPKEIAAQLQKKGLISIPLMKELIISPESQQAKIITLIDALYEMIKSQPEHLFSCIEVMVKNDALQEAGRELLTEAGKNKNL